VLKNLSLLLIIFILGGCSASTKIVIPNHSDEAPFVTGSVVNSSAFAKGGTLVLKSFKAGDGAAADEETDRLSSMVIKGITDTLPGENTKFTFQTQDPDDSDFYLAGHIENYGDASSVHNMGLRKNQVYLSLDGEIWLRETGEKVLLFQTSTIFNLKTQDPTAEAYQIGVGIAHYIGSASK
jgi:hypothetical protein